MRKYLLTITLAMIALFAFAQTGNRHKSINIELLGPSNMIGLSYDARFKPGSNWGYRTGIGYSYGFAENFLIGESENHSVTVPLEINYLVGKKKHHLELGAGTSLGVYHESLDIYVEDFAVSAKETTFGYFIYGNVGYRYNANNGFQFRCGVMPSFNFGDDHGVSHDPDLYPYISVGYAF